MQALSYEGQAFGRDDYYVYVGVLGHDSIQNFDQIVVVGCLEAWIFFKDAKQLVENFYALSPFFRLEFHLKVIGELGKNFGRLSH